VGVTPEAEAVTVTVGQGVVDGPTGNKWGQVLIQLGLVSATFVLPEKTLRDLAEALPKQLLACADDVRRQRAGLVMPTGLDLSKLQNGNGAHP